MSPLAIAASRVPVALYVPNLLCYNRIVTAFVGLYLSQNDYPVAALWTWILSSVLDLFDGMLARALNQTSKLGVFLDIAADNVLRTAVWMAVMMEHPHLAPLTCMIVCMEWFTMVTTQLHTATDDGHWKEARSHDPWFVQQVFKGGFKNPLGIFTIYGLFCAQLFLWASNMDVITKSIPFFDTLKYTAYAARAFAFTVELYVSSGYLAHVIDQDTKRRDAEDKKKR